jgi:putative glycosyltransferase (TIGR04348 family)
MKIIIVTPAPPGSRKGNRVTALRWARHLRHFGHRVAIRQHYQGESCGLLIALHARRSFAAADCFRKRFPDRPLVLALTGTDLYGDIHTDRRARLALEMASRLIVLQPLGIEELPAHLRPKARVIYQSLTAPRPTGPRRGVFEICVLGHLREVKDPFRAAAAARLLAEESRARVLHLGGALSASMARRAKKETETNPRYRWLGDVPRWRALRLLARCRLLVQSSLVEGGANSLSEAIAAGVPVLSSRIAGSVGILGADYPGYFPVGDTEALALLIQRAESNADFYRTLKTWCGRLKGLVAPAAERASWRRLLSEIA